MGAFKSIIFLLLFIFKTIDDVHCGCTLSLQKDFSKPSPVFLRNNAYLAPDDTGAISLKRSETITIGCPGDRRFIVLKNYTSSYNVLEAHCIINQTFRVDRWTGEFKDISCTGPPHYVTQQTSRKCHNGGKIYGVGYKIKSQFYKLYEACFNSDLLTTYYVKHEISPTSRFMQSGSSRPNFIEGDLFGKVRMSKLYKLQNQKNQLDSILGANMSEKYITKKQFLTRGHLAARADFTLRAESQATFHYVNAAPQWQRGNAGDWAALEDALRRRVQTLGRPVTVHTGTHFTLSLPDAESAAQPIYLHVDANNNGLVPVPLYFYKLVYDPQRQTATAFVSINSSFYNVTTIDQLTFCSDVCDGDPRFSWLRWRSNDGTHSFCCDYGDFVSKIDYLNKLNVNGLFF